MGNKAKVGSVVGLYYRGGIKGEEAVDERVEGEPLVVMIGDMKLPRGIELALEGMEAGEEKRLDVPPELGYGEYQEALAQCGEFDVVYEAVAGCTISCHCGPNTVSVIFARK